MRVILAVGALASLAGAAIRLINGDFRWAAICAFSFWMCAGWFIAVVSANRTIDNAIREDDE